MHRIGIVPRKIFFLKKSWTPHRIENEKIISGKIKIKLNKLKLKVWAILFVSQLRTKWSQVVTRKSGRHILISKLEGTWSSYTCVRLNYQITVTNTKNGKYTPRRIATVPRTKRILYLNNVKIRGQELKKVCLLCLCD